MRSRPETLTWPGGVATESDAPPAASQGRVVGGRAQQQALPARVRLEGALRAAQRALASHKAATFIVLFALALTSVALTLKLTADDHFHALALRAEPGLAGVQRAPWDIFAFAKNAEVNGALVEEGVFPWWSDREAVISFFRPLSSLTHYLDHVLWEGQPALMHLHSLLWFAALLFVVAAVHRQHAASPWIAGLALLIYAVDDARAMTVGWISNRNALVALVPAFGALALHHRWRSERKAGYAVASAACLALGLFSAEAALQVCGYLAAYALCLESGSLPRRLRTLLPYLAVVLVWRSIYVGLGYGAFGSEFYIDPGRAPLAYAQNLFVRLPVLLLAQFGMPFADLWDAYPVFLPAFRVVIPVLGLAVMATLLWLLWPLLRDDRRVRFWALGTLLATLPVCGASPTDRLLTATGVGAAALIASLIAAVAERSYPALGRWQLGLVGCLVFVHLGMAPLLLPLRTRAVDVMEGLIARAAASAPADAAIEEKTLVILNPPAEHFAGYFPLYRESNGIPRPKHFRWLATGLSAIDLERVDANTLRVRPEGGFLASEIQWFLRSRERPFHLHDRVELMDMTIEITELTDDQRPAEVLARFREPLESKSLQFMQWGEHEYVPMQLPAIGKRMHIPGVDLRSALLGDSAG